MLTPHKAKPQVSLQNDRIEAISLPLQAGGKDAIGSDCTKIRRESEGDGPIESNRNGGHSSIVKLILGPDSGIDVGEHIGQP